MAVEEERYLIPFSFLWEYIVFVLLFPMLCPTLLQVSHHVEITPKRMINQKKHWKLEKSYNNERDNLVIAVKDWLINPRDLSSKGAN